MIDDNFQRETQNRTLKFRPEVRAGGQSQSVSRDGCGQETTFANVGDAHVRSRAFRLQQHSH